MDYGKAFTFVFDDEEWVQKLLIGGILGLIPIVNLVVIGYGLKVLKNVADGMEQPLPAWDDFGDYFVQGLMSFLGSLVWAIPILIVVMLTAFLSAVAGAGYGYDTSAAQAAPFHVCTWGLSCLSTLYGLFMGVVLPAAITRYAISGEFGAFFRFGEIFNYITSNLGSYIIALLLGFVAHFISGFGVIFCIVGVVFTAFWAILVSSHLLGQVYLESVTPGSESVV